MTGYAKPPGDGCMVQRIDKQRCFCWDFKLLLGGWVSVIWQNIPNRITTLRLLMVPVLWLLAFGGYPIAVGLGLAFCGCHNGQSHLKTEMLPKALRVLT